MCHEERESKLFAISLVWLFTATDPLLHLATGSKRYQAQLAGAVEYADCISAEG